MCFSVQVERDLSKLQRTLYRHLPVTIDKNAFLYFDSARTAFPKVFRGPDSEDRIYPGSFLPVLRWDGSGYSLAPMRYRVRPAGSIEEVPAKYNLFNARLDSLTSRKTWRSLLGKSHGLIYLKEFYEWVEGESGEKKLVGFSSREELMRIPVLYDFFENEDYHFYSCALITVDPPPEVLEAGHDRCPLFLSQNSAEAWLKPEGLNQNEVLNVLDAQVETFYSVRELSKPAKLQKNEELKSDQLSLFGHNEKKSQSH